VKNLIEFIIAEGVVDEKRHRQAYLASELLKCDEISIIEHSFINSELTVKDDTGDKKAFTGGDSINDFEELKLNEEDQLEEENKKEADFVSEIIESEEACKIDECNAKLKYSNIELFDYLLTFINTDNALNHILADYFSGLLFHLLSVRPEKVKLK
jgi:hypothetical protein